MLYVSPKRLRHKPQQAWRSAVISIVIPVFIPVCLSNVHAKIEIKSEHNKVDAFTFAMAGGVGVDGEGGDGWGGLGVGAMGGVGGVWGWF